MGCLISIIATLVVVNCPTPPQDVAAILAVAPGLSNRTNVFTLSREDLRPRVVLVPSPAAPTPQKAEPESDTARAIRMGIPGGYTPLEWAILNGGR